MEPCPRPALPAWGSGLRELLVSGEMQLMERVLAFAKVQGYAAYTSTLVEPWRVSIAGLTAAICDALDVCDGTPREYPIGLEFPDDPVAAFAALEAERHRKRGVTLAMFWGLLKYYRRAYLELIGQGRLPAEEAAAAGAFVAECFERMEFVFVLRWAKLSGQTASDELGRENLCLANEKNKYLTVFESIPHGLFLLDAKDGLENSNTMGLRMIGYGGAAGSLYYADARLGHEDVRRAVRGRPLAELLPWLGPALEQSADAGRVVTETQTSVGEQAWVYDVVVEHLADISGKFAGKVVVCRDVTERRRTEQALAQSEERYRTLIDIMHQGLAVLSPDGRVDFANETLGQMLGHPLGEIVGRPLADCIRGEDRPRFVEALDARRQGLAEPYEMGLLRADGRTLCVMASPSPITGPDNDYQGSLEVYTDITRLRQLEAQLATAKRLEAIGHLAGGVAHEINTPLQYVTGNLDFAKANLPRLLSLLDKYETALFRAREGDTLETARQDIEAFRREHDLETVLTELPLALEESLEGVERVAGFVRSIKRFARTEGMGRQAIDVNEAILATVEMARSAQEFPICLETDLAENLPPLPCVPGDFNQLLLCLLINAAQATEKTGRLDACVRVASRLEGHNVAVSVTDKGTGIPLEIQDKIFNPFYTTHDVGKGGGQGLSIALAIVERHKGAIRFVTEAGRGTTFHVTFPLEESG
ncbi:MAG: PAS domain-containing sensor histidine kinase [Solidesulfovibrio sp. DCME]|uniref:PAS domain-containing sensor histidine kinase n=1 Tax=Solidesulfovibrio sp. DCME TaxID=3447380 RepID=UPI003D0E22CB